MCFPSSPAGRGRRPLPGLRASRSPATRSGSTWPPTRRASASTPATRRCAWEVWNGEAWVRTIVESDGTGGLNKAGSVVLLVPQAHEPLMLGGTLAHWLRVRLLRPQPGQPTYQASPRIASIALHAIGSTVPAEHASAAARRAARPLHGRPGQAFLVSTTPVAARRDDETSWSSTAGARTCGGGARLLRVRAGRPARRVGLEHRRGPVRPRDPVPRRRRPPARRDPAGRRRDPRHRLPLRRRRARQRRRPHAHRAAHRPAVRRRR